MKVSQKIALAALLLLLVAAVAGVFFTRDSSRATPRQQQSGPASGQAPLVDEQPLRMARALAPLAATTEEQTLAKEALHLADHDVDLAFAIAMRQATENPPPPTRRTREIVKRVQAAQKTVEGDQQEIARLTKQLAGASGAPKEKLQEDLDDAKAQLDPDLDDLEEAKQELIRAGGDPRARIAQMKEAHEAVQHEGGLIMPSSGAPQRQASFRGGLATDLAEWTRLRSKTATLFRARTEAQEKVQNLARQRQELKQQFDTEREKTPTLRDRSVRKAAPELQAAAQEAARHLGEERSELADFDKRISDEKALGEIYGKWGEIAGGQARAALHEVLLDGVWLLIVLLVLVGFGAWLDHFFARLSDDNRRLVTLQTVLRVTVQAASIVVALLFIFGLPAQLATMIGLAGAGLTVALKDFIVGFFGWFVLMGKNGIRLGDWVEINGVSGEVVEIGLFRTVLLETGNWTDAGHPTGRRVTFANGFAIEGHYFNFSTTGQWLWDELQIVVPVTENPYPMVDGIRKVVTATTAENVRQAEEEWRRATRSRGMSAISAEPAINIRPVPMGIEIAVRYITRANERYQLRTKLYNEMVGLLGHKPVSLQPAAEPASEGAKKAL